MSAHCHHDHSAPGHSHGAPAGADPRYRRILWIALAVNAALGVLGTGTVWPGLVVAALMAGLAIGGGWNVIRHARQELASTAAGAQPQGQ